MHNLMPTSQVAAYIGVGYEEIVALILELCPDWMLEQYLRDTIAIVQIVCHALERTDNLCFDRGCIVNELQTTVQ